MLREKVFAAIKGRLVIKWEPFLQISVAGTAWNLDDFVEATQINPTLSFDIEVQVARIEIGTRPDGSQCYRAAGTRTHESGSGQARWATGPTTTSGGTRGRGSPTPRRTGKPWSIWDVPFFSSAGSFAISSMPDNVDAAVAQLVTDKTLAGLPAPSPAKTPV